MKIREIYFIVLSIFVSLNCRAEAVSAYSLVGNQNYWNGKEVAVTGFLFVDRASLLYINSESMKYHQRVDSFFIDVDRDFISAFKHLDGKRIILIGKFYSGDYLGPTGKITVDEAESEKMLKLLYGYEKKPIDEKVSSLPPESTNK